MTFKHVFRIITNQIRITAERNELLTYLAHNTVETVEAENIRCDMGGQLYIQRLQPKLRGQIQEIDTLSYSDAD